MFWATGVLGVLLFIAPWVLGYSGNPTAFWSSIVLGALIVVFSLIKGLVHDATNWDYWLTGILGILAIIAPFVLGFSSLSGALYACVILGAITLILSAIMVMVPGRRLRLPDRERPGGPWLPLLAVSGENGPARGTSSGPGRWLPRSSSYTPHKVGQATSPAPHENQH
jgi:hypothetical protein